MYYKDNHTIIHIYKTPEIDSRMYVIQDTMSIHEGLVIDPSIREDTLPLLRSFTSIRILLTHSHYDHISGVNWLKEHTNATLICSKKCAEKIQDPHQNLAAFAPALYIDRSKDSQQICQDIFQLDYACKADNIYTSELSFTLGNHQVETRQTPGHSSCSQCIILTNRITSDKIIFTGDSLVNGHEIITRLPDGNKEDYKKITKPFLDTIDQDTIIMPGHGDWGKKKEM